MEETVSKISEKIKYTMCGRNGSCCPVLEQVDEFSFTIKDDYDGTVVLTKEQLSLLKDFLVSTNLK